MELARGDSALGWLRYAMHSPMALLWSRFGVATTSDRPMRNRKLVAATVLRGKGIEVGALHEPLVVPPWIAVRYVDRLSVAELRAHYPELDALPLVEPDIIDNGEALPTVPDRSEDFLIANHFIEHCEDPIGALTNFCRVVRPGGTIYLAVPDKRHTFDKTRALTPFEHLVRDHEEGPDWSRRDHYHEVVTVTESVAEEERIRARLDDLMGKRYSIHFHVWTHTSFLVFLCATAERYQLPFEIELAMRNGMESIFVLRRC
jgi:predicted SAM-dependent methyltransferase